MALLGDNRGQPQLPEASKMSTLMKMLCFKP
jgi:hypothetical protein